jgi:protein-disulfide isomerase
VRSTPTFFLNGLPIVGAQPFEVFQEVVEKELAGEIPQ